MGLPAPKFDTLSFAKALKDAGVNEKQAEVYAEKQAEIIQMLQDEQLVTKDDIHRLEIEIVKGQQAIKGLEDKLHLELKELDTKMQSNNKSLEMKIQQSIANLVTKDEMVKVKEDISKIKEDINAINSKIQGMSNSLLIKLGGLLIGTVALMHSLHNFI